MSRTVEVFPGACAVHIPAVSGRVLYYFVDYFDSDGKPAGSEPGVAAVP